MLPQEHLERRHSVLLAVALGVLAGCSGVAWWFLPPGLGGWRVEVRSLHPGAGHPRSVAALAVDPGSGRLASADDGGGLRVWDPVRGRPIARARVEGYVEALAWCEGEVVALTGEGRSWWWRVGAAAPRPRAACATASRALALGPEGDLLCIGEGGEAVVEKRGRGRRVAVLPAELRNLVVAAEGSSIAVVGGGGRGGLWRSGVQVAAWDARETVNRLWSGPGGLWAGREDGALRRLPDGPWIPLQGALPLAVGGTSDAAVALLPDPAVAPLARDGKNPERRRLSGPRARVAVDDPERGLMIFGGWDGVVRVYRRVDGRLLHALDPPPLTLATSPHGRWVATSHGAGVVGEAEVWLWSTVASGRVVHRMRRPGEAAVCVEFDPSGRWLLTRDRRHRFVSYRVADGVRADPPPRVDRICPRSAKSRYDVTVWRQVVQDELTLVDRRTGWAAGLGGGFLRARPLTRSAVDRLTGSVPLAAITSDGGVELARLRPRWPSSMVLLGLLVTAAAIGLRELRRRWGERRSSGARRV